MTPYYFWTLRPIWPPLCSSESVRVTNKINEPNSSRGEENSRSWPINFSLCDLNYSLIDWWFYFLIIICGPRRFTNLARNRINETHVSMFVAFELSFTQSLIHFVPHTNSLTRCATLWCRVINISLAINYLKISGVSLSLFLLHPLEHKKIKYIQLVQQTRSTSTYVKSNSKLELWCTCPKGAQRKTN